MADELQPLIIEAAVNGATPKSRNPHVPRTPQEIAQDMLRCIDVGATIVHNHNEEPVIGGSSGVHSAEPYIEAWRQVLAKHPDVLLYPTMAGGGPHTTFEERYAHVPALAEAGVLRMGLVDPGSVNVGGLDAEGLPMAIDRPYINTLKDARGMFAECERLNLAPSISCFEPGFVRVAAAMAKAGRMPQGALVKFYFSGANSVWGLPPTEASLNAYLGIIEGTGLQWSVALLGGDVVDCGLARLAIKRGGHVRVGLEDYAGRYQPQNAALVRELVSLARSLGRKVATIEEANEILGVPKRAEGLAAAGA